MTENHPSRNAEFLSRLHDGDLSPAERAHFESHRAHCSECRHAAAEFEAALSLYRSSRPTPASPDLAGRILRKLQSNPSRRPRFGPAFGIDLRWAGAFAAAVVAAIVGSTIVGRHEARESLARTAAPIPIVVRSQPERVPAPAAAPPEAPAPEARADAPQETAEAPARTASGRGFARKTGAPREPAKEQTLAKSLEETGAAAGKLSSSEEERLESRRNAGLRQREAASSEVKVESPPVPAEHPAPQAAAADMALPAPARARAQQAPAAVSAVRARLRVEAADGLPAPALAGEPPPLPLALRGRSWTVVVDAAGRVHASGEQDRDKRKDAAARDELQSDPPPEILGLRFAAGDRERRVLLRVE